MEAPDMAREISRIEAEIARLRKRQEDAVRVNVARWLATTNSAEKPQWVECGKDEVVLQPQGTRFAGPDWEAANAPLVAALNSSFAVLLVRPSGFDACAAVRRILEAHRIEYDLAPVDESWQLVFR
jgi:hypothetical protein